LEQAPSFSEAATVHDNEVKTQLGIGQHNVMG
jgi:hypothetical protein